MTSQSGGEGGWGRGRRGMGGGGMGGRGNVKTSRKTESHDVFYTLQTFWRSVS
jgi:hypothetical protein